jgi:hypothetical protein
MAFDIYEEKRSLLAELAPLVDAGLLKIDIQQPTLKNAAADWPAAPRLSPVSLSRACGTGPSDPGDEQGRRDDQSGARFTQILRLCPDLRLAVFAGCETARAPWDPVATDARANDLQPGRSVRAG